MSSNDWTICPNELRRIIQRKLTETSTGFKCSSSTHVVFTYACNANTTQKKNRAQQKKRKDDGQLVRNMCKAQRVAI
jgi:hypothetical protein